MHGLGRADGIGGAKAGWGASAQLVPVTFPLAPHVATSWAALLPYWR